MAREIGHTALYLVGTAAYYQRFGFKPTATLRIKYTQDIPNKNVMGCGPVPDAPHGATETVDCIRHGTIGSEKTRPPARRGGSILPAHVMW
ncbi:MAG: hypothetical protein JW765_06380 [Deltaproteobacteria bacterium]|nr:hypothetical protein [Candidatus Zymogenaceae bacterium]